MKTLLETADKMADVLEKFIAGAAQQEHWISSPAMQQAIDDAPEALAAYKEAVILLHIPDILKTLQERISIELQCDGDANGNHDLTIKLNIDNEEICYSSTGFHIPTSRDHYDH